MVLTRSNKVYYNDADDVENKRNSANVAKVVSTIEKAAFVPPPERNLRNMILGEIWKEIKKKKGDETEGSSYGIITSILNKNKAQFPWLTRNMINYFKKKKLCQKSLTCHPKEAMSPQPQTLLMSSQLTETMLFKLY